MIKYAKVDGYKNRGEIKLLSHVYQLIENNTKEPMVILIHAYEGPTEVFKGYLYNETKKYKSVKLEKNEIEEIEAYCSKLKQVEFDEFISKTVFSNDYTEYEKL